MKTLEVREIVIISALMSIVLLWVMMRDVVVIAVEAVKGVHGGLAFEDIEEDVEKGVAVVGASDLFIIEGVNLWTKQRVDFFEASTNSNLLRFIKIKKVLTTVILLFK